MLLSSESTGEAKVAPKAEAGEDVWVRAGRLRIDAVRLSSFAFSGGRESGVRWKAFRARLVLSASVVGTPRDRPCSMPQDWIWFRSLLYTALEGSCSPTGGSSNPKAWVD